MMTPPERESPFSRAGPKLAAVYGFGTRRMHDMHASTTPSGATPMFCTPLHRHILCGPSIIVTLTAHGTGAPGMQYGPRDLWHRIY